MAPRVVGPVFLIAQAIIILLLLAHITNNGFIVLVLPMLLGVIAGIIFLIPRRNNPDYISYPFFHPSQTFIILVILSVLFIIGLAIYIQLTQHAFF